MSKSLHWPHGPDAGATAGGSRLLLGILSLLWLLPGCEHGANPLPGSARAENRSEPSARPHPVQQAIPTLQPQPGTELREADFQKTLQATGADLIVVEVYLESCGACMTEALKLVKREAAWRARGVAILGLGMDETAQGPQAFYEMTGRRITYPLYLAPWFARQQEVQRTPTLFIYSADGRQLFRTDGQHAKEGIMVALEGKLSEWLAVHNLNP